MTFDEVQELRDKITEIEEYLTAKRDESGQATQAAINEALRILFSMHDTTHQMDSAIEKEGC